MKSYRVWEETSLHFWDQFQWGQWNPSTLEEKAPGVACLHPLDFWLPACGFPCAQAQTPRTSSSVSRLSPTLRAPGTSSASFPCAARQTAALSTAPLLHLLFPVCSFRGHSPHTRRPSQRKEAEACGVTPEEEAPLWLHVGSFPSFSTASSVHIIKYLLSVHSCFSQ